MYTLEMCETREGVCVCSVYQSSPSWSWLQLPLLLLFLFYLWLKLRSWFCLLEVGSLPIFTFWLGIGQNSVYCSNKDFYGYLNFYFISSQTLFIASFSSLSFLSRVHEPVLFSLCSLAPFQALCQHPSCTSLQSHGFSPNTTLTPWELFSVLQQRSVFKIKSFSVWLP